MRDRYRPASAEVRAAAEQAIARLDGLTRDGQLTDGRDIRRRAPDSIEGAHSNLRIAENLARATNPYRKLTHESLTLEALHKGTPSIRLGVSSYIQEGRVLLMTPNGTDYTLTDRRIDSIYARAIYVPNRALLLNRFGHQSPAELIGIARSEAEREARRGRTIFSRFTGRGR